MNREKIIEAAKVLLFLSILTMSMYLFFYSSPEALTDWIGVENGYILIFFLAFVGGLTTFSGVPYYLVLIALAMGGLNPWILGTSAAIGVMIGDSTSYYIGYQGGGLIPKRAKKFLDVIREFGMQHPKMLPFLFFLYASTIPLSNDFIVISMGLSRYPFWRVMIPLGLGNIVFNVTVSYLAVYAQDFLRAIF